MFFKRTCPTNRCSSKRCEWSLGLPNHMKRYTNFTICQSYWSRSIYSIIGLVLNRALSIEYITLAIVPSCSVSLMFGEARHPWSLQSPWQNGFLACTLYCILFPISTATVSSRPSSIKQDCRHQRSCQTCNALRSLVAPFSRLHVYIQRDHMAPDTNNLHIDNDM